MATSIFEVGKRISNMKIEMADLDPLGKYDENVIVNPVYDNGGAIRGYEPSQTWKYQDVANLQYESQLIKMAVDDFYKAYEDKGVITGLINNNNFELVNNKLRVKGSSIDLVSKITGRPLAISSIKSQQGGSALLRKIELNSATSLSQKTVTALQNFDFQINQLNEWANVIETNILPQIVEEVDTSIATLLNGINAPVESEFTLRELRGLDKTMQTSWQISE